MTNKKVFALIMAYSVAVAFWNLVFSIIILGFISIIAYISETDTLSFYNFLRIYIINYIILFIFNLGTLKNYIKEKE